MGLAEDHQTCLQASLDIGAVLACDQIAGVAETAGGDCSLERDAQILQQEGHAGERALGQAVGDGPAGIILVIDRDGVEGGVHGAGAREGGVEEFRFRHLSGADPLREVQRVQTSVLLE